MKLLIRRAAAGVLVALGFAGPASAQGNYPARPIRLIVPFPPGGGTDILARTVANKLTETLGWQIVVDNRAGAGGSIGLDAAAKATPDGYTMVMGQTSNLTINPALYSKLPYDSIRDFAPVSLVSASPVALLVEAKSPLKTVADLVSAAKARPDQITFGSSGNGTVGHLSGERAAQAMPDLFGGRINVYLPSLETAMPHLKAGTIRAIAVTAAQRVSAVPDIPTVAETYKGFEAITWFGILVTSGTPAPVVNRLSAEITKALQAPDIKERFAATGGVIVQPGPGEFAALIRAELEKWGRIVKEAGVKIN